MKGLLFIVISIAVLYTADIREMVPYTKGVTNFSHANPFWLVSPVVMSDLLTAYSVRTNYIQKIEAQKTIINTFALQTNLDNQMYNLINVELQRTQKELERKKVEIVLWTSGGLVIGIGFTALIYHLAGSHIKSITQ